MLTVYDVIPRISGILASEPKAPAEAVQAEQRFVRLVQSSNVVLWNWSKTSDGVCESLFYVAI